MADKKSTAKKWVVGIAIVVLIAIGAYVFIRSTASADVAIPPISNPKSFSKTVVAATLIQDFTSGATQGTYMSARITQGSGIGRQIYIAVKKNATTFVTPSSGSFYSYGSFCGSPNACAKLKKGDKILVSGDLINGFLKYPLIAADSITLTTKRANVSVDTRGDKGFKSEAFKYVVIARVTGVKDYYNIMITLLDGNIGTTPEKIHLSPIWGISSVSSVKEGDVVLIGLNQARGFVVGSDSGVTGPEGSLYTADSIAKVVGAQLPASPTPRPSVTSTIACSAVSPRPGQSVSPCAVPPVPSPTPVPTQSISMPDVPPVPSPGRTGTCFTDSSGRTICS